ncbi:MAG: FAD:protein FMN transferase [Pseudomonadota bacterium]
MAEITNDKGARMSEALNAPGIFRFPFRAMASVCEVVLEAEDARAAAQLAKAAIDEVARIERKYSRYRPDSVITRINGAAGHAWVDCDDETVDLLDFGHSLFEASAGRFDMTSGVLRQAWDFKRAVLPDAHTLARLSALVGWDKVERQGARLRLPLAGMELDVGGFGKEYAADRAARALSAAGATSAYVNLAGDLHVLGPRPDGSAWLIGIQHPRQQARVLATIPIMRGALATSGDYERFFLLDGRRYCHILNPGSGLPVDYWQSVSVLAPLAIDAGAKATIAMLLEQDGLAFLEGTGLRYLAVDREGIVHQAGAHK